MNRIQQMYGKHRDGLVAGAALGDMSRVARLIETAIEDGDTEHAVRNLRRLARLMIGDDAEIVRTTEHLILCPRCRLERTPVLDPARDAVQAMFSRWPLAGRKP